uniref:Uncharacterized protein n=1 Tax=Trypanosoma congolense (strain IL3000) TaxID=1068625 RepID=G0UQ13_TRYCI|nr:conserved hypothetical protein [Trypanosoma congolense IL3000]
MYDPAVPNNYREFKIAQWKRAREEEERSGSSRTQGNMILRIHSSPDPIDVTSSMQCDALGTSAPPPTAGDGPLGAVEVLPLHLSAEEMHQRRLRQSAALGIATAVRLERDELEVAHKVKVATGTDLKGRIGMKLEKLREVFASTTGTNGGFVGSGESGDSSRGNAPAGMPPSGGSAPLVFQRSKLAAGGYMVKEETSSHDNRKMSSGKPSSTILIRFIRDGPHPDIFEMETGTSVGNAAGGFGPACLAFLESIQSQCARYGVVRSVRPALLTEAQRTAVRARLVECSPTPADVEMRFGRELVRVLVRFDTVAGAFKALDALQQNCSNWSVCFFPTLLFDAGALGPAEGEMLCGT